MMTFSIFFTRISTVRQSGQEHIFRFVFIVTSEMIFETGIMFALIIQTVLITRINTV